MFVKGKRSARGRQKSPKKNPTSDSLATPIKIVGVKQDRKFTRVTDLYTKVQSMDHNSSTRVSNSPPVQIPGSSQPSSFEGGIDETCTLFFNKINEKFAELQRKLFESEKRIAHITSLKDEEVNKLKKDLEELSLEKSEWIARELDLMENIAHITSLKDKEVNKLKTDLEALSLEKCEWIARESDLMEKNSKIKLKLQMEIDTHKGNVEKLNAEIEELKVQIPLQYQAGIDKAVKQFLVSISELKL